MILTETSVAPETTNAGVVTSSRRKFLHFLALSGIIGVSASGMPAGGKGSSNIQQTTLAGLTTLLHPAVPSEPELTGLKDRASILNAELQLGETPARLERREQSLVLTLGKATYIVEKVNVLGKMTDPGTLIHNIGYNESSHSLLVIPATGVPRTLVTRASVSVRDIERALITVAKNSKGVIIMVDLPCRPEGPAINAARAADCIPGVDIDTQTARITLRRIGQAKQQHPIGQ